MQENSNKTKLTMQFLLGVIVVFAGIVMLFMGIFIPPTGIIDASILVAFGEISTFSGALIGIDYSYKFKQYQKDNKEHNDN